MQKKKENLVRDLKEQLDNRYTNLDFNISYYLYDREMFINVYNRLEQNTGDYNTIILHYADEKNIVDYLVEIDRAVEYKQFSSVYVADSMERFLISLFKEYDLMSEFYVSGGEIYSSKIEDGSIPLRAINKVDYTKDKHTVKLFDDDMDIYYHMIDLNNNKYNCITTEGKEETEQEELQYKIDFLINARPFNFNFKVDNDTLCCKAPGQTIYDCIADVKDIQDIDFIDDCIGFNFRDDAKHSELGTIFINKEGEIYA